MKGMPLTTGNDRTISTPSPLADLSVLQPPGHDPEDRRRSGHLPIAGSAALYVDGFNLYHSIRDLNEPWLRWVNLWRLGELLVAPQRHSLVRVVWCSAQSQDGSKAARHRDYKKALESVGVSCLTGHFSKEDRSCVVCKNKWQAPTEKEGDVNLAITIIDDAHHGVCENVYLLTADSDQAATVSLFKRRFPERTIWSVAPPGRFHSQAIISQLKSRKHITKVTTNYLEKSVWDGRAVMKDGAVVVMRPDRYAPKNGWVHPDRRPTKKP